MGSILLHRHIDDNYREWRCTSRWYHVGDRWIVKLARTMWVSIEIEKWKVEIDFLNESREGVPLTPTVRRGPIRGKRLLTTADSPTPMIWWWGVNDTCISFFESFLAFSRIQFLNCIVDYRCPRYPWTSIVQPLFQPIQSLDLFFLQSQCVYMIIFHSITLCPFPTAS